MGRQGFAPCNCENEHCEMFASVYLTAAEIHKLGLYTDGVSGLRDMVPCVGTTYCPKAVSTTRELFDALLALTSSPKYQAVDDYARINITGCPNSCSPYRITDIGFRGMRIREERGSVEAYEMLINGKRIGHFSAAHDDRRQRIYFHSRPVVFAGGEKLT